MLNVSCLNLHFLASGVILADISRDRPDLNAGFDVIVVRFPNFNSRNHTRCSKTHVIPGLPLEILESSKLIYYVVFTNTHY